jgi:hypothetical protein
MIAGAVLLALSPLASGAASPVPDLIGTPERLQLVAGRARIVDYRGRHALQLMPLAGHENDDGDMLAIVPGTDFKDGTLELDVAGSPRPGSDPTSRGFIGIAFRVQGAAEKFECFYIRPTNGRAEDQLQRNHSVQYVSEPEFGWSRLRTEHPGVYESYADLEAGAWTHLRIVVSGTKARCFVNGASQPALIVNDLKLGEVRGAVALWSHASTDGYFSNLSVKN